VLSVLQQILCWIQQIGAMVLNALIMVINLLIAAVGALAGLVVALLPGMPDPPAQPPSDILNAVNWLFPLGPILAGCIVIGALWTTYLVIRVALRWVKAL
jgi:hypothetical protein